ncbi:hypothetical protein EAO75_29900 [Streptomyces sp. uw30]|uniref:hypothetical protein n=1 Tax=Streptomyces sp. uw30 TaxID=1828179 RepID=UPI0011CE0B4E|nr:hypothetical protein [Streptomyces sp. uw30]TXS44031.1 hypothetical protein EAO75_29900 [Streptomyces sp. uw30]
MAGHKGWTFTVKGREGLVLRGQENAATYTATVRRTTGDSWALHSTGSALSKGVRKPEEIYVADGTAYVKKGTVAWELRARTTTAPLTGVRDRGVVQKALRELAPTLRQLRTAGVTAPEIRYEQDVTERTLGTYVGTVARPEGLR